MTNYLFDGLLNEADRSAKFATVPALEPEDKERWYIYQDVFDVSARISNVLQVMGVKVNDRVAVQVPKSIEALMLYLAVVRVGAVFLPLNTGYTSSEVAYFLSDAAPSLFICDPKQKGQYAELCETKSIRLETLGVWKNHNLSAGTIADESLKASTEFQDVPRGPDDLAAILYTSGTTGRSKGAMLTHQNLLSNANTLVDYWHFTKDDVLLHALPIFHTHGLFVATNTILKSGGSMIILPAFQIDHMIDLLPRATSLMGVPTFYTRLLNDERFTKALTSHMRLFISGSAPLLAETHKAFHARTNHHILERYGMTETNMNTSNPYDGERRAGTVGFALPGTSIRISCPDTKMPIQDGEIGVLEVKGANVFKGYWQMPDKTAEEFRSDGYFITGDLAYQDPQGYITIVGRSKDLIISGGYNIYPKEIELLLDDMPDVLESAVIGVPHPDFGEAVVAILIAKDKSEIDLQAIEQALTDQIAKFKKPKKLFVLKELPRNTMGKVQKNLLRERHKDVFA